MADIDIDKHIIDALKPLLPRTWVAAEFGTLVDNINKVTYILSLRTVAKDPAAPIVARVANYFLTIYAPAGMKRSKLDDDLFTLLNAIDGLSGAGLRWSLAEFGTKADGQNYGYDITLEFRFNKETDQ